MGRTTDNNPLTSPTNPMSRKLPSEKETRGGASINITGTRLMSASYRRMCGEHVGEDGRRMSDAIKNENTRSGTAGKYELNYFDRLFGRGKQLTKIVIIARAHKQICYASSSDRRPETVSEWTPALRNSSDQAIDICANVPTTDVGCRPQTPAKTNINPRAHSLSC
jgi:hypothetical protein